MSHIVVRLMAALEEIRQRRQSGQAMVEYALILALISVVAIAMLTIIGTEVNDVFNNIAQRLQAAP